jgi:hypothetical protein
MKRFILLIFILFCSCLTVYNQVIKGTICDQYTKIPIDYALVYINGTFVGTHTDKNGNFELNISKNSIMPLTVSALGYYSNTLTGFSRDTALLVFLTPKVFELTEVVVTDKANSKARKTNLKLFKDAFLGTTQNARNCKITNENDIKLMYNSNNDTLKAFSSKPIQIDNKALGYKISYYLDKFEYDRRSNSFFFRGNIIFNEDVKTSNTQKRRFERRRKSAYLGSRMHFFRALWDNNLDSAGFKVMNMPRNVLLRDEFVFQTDSLETANPGKYLIYQYPLHIAYKRVVPKTIIDMNKEGVYFEKNGYFDPIAITWEGEMAKQRIADWLPYEYSIK